jgi:hypothetical protein
MSIFCWLENPHKNGKLISTKLNRSSEKYVILNSKENWQLLLDCNIYNLLIMLAYCEL